MQQNSNRTRTRWSTVTNITNVSANRQRKRRSVRAGGKVDCNAVVCVADGMCAEETCGSGSGGEAHRVRWPAAISPMRPLQSASFVASQRQTSCWCSERTGARTVKTRKRAFMSSVKSPWGECLAPGGFHQRDLLTPRTHKSRVGARDARRMRAVSRQEGLSQEVIACDRVGSHAKHVSPSISWHGA